MTLASSNLLTPSTPQDSEEESDLPHSSSDIDGDLSLPHEYHRFCTPFEHNPSFYRDSSQDLSTESSLTPLSSTLPTQPNPTPAEPRSSTPIIPSLFPSVVPPPITPPLVPVMAAVAAPPPLMPVRGQRTAPQFASNEPQQLS
jgi:hypothetical protein